MDIEDVINPPARVKLAYPIAEPTDPSDDQSRRAEKDERHRLAIQDYNEEMRRRKAEDNAKFNGLQIGDIEKKLKSKLYWHLEEKDRNASHTKILGKEYWKLTLLNTGNY